MSETPAWGGAARRCAAQGGGDIFFSGEGVKKGPDGHLRATPGNSPWEEQPRQRAATCLPADVCAPYPGPVRPSGCLGSGSGSGMQDIACRRKRMNAPSVNPGPLLAFPTAPQRL